MAYYFNVSETDQSQRLAELEARCAQQEASLATYKETLDEIYALYATGVEALSFIRRLSDSLRLTLDQKKVCLAMVEIAMEELTPDGCFLLLLDRAGRFRLKASARLGRPARYWPEGDPVQDEAGVWARGPLAGRSLGLAVGLVVVQGADHPAGGDDVENGALFHSSYPVTMSLPLVNAPPPA